MLAIHTPKKFFVHCLLLEAILIWSTFLNQSFRSMVIEIKLAVLVTGMAAYDYDLRLCSSIPKAGPLSKL